MALSPWAAPWTGPIVSCPGTAGLGQPLNTASLLDSRPACLSSPLPYMVSGSLGVIFIHALGCEMAELMSNTSHQRLKIPEHTGREVNSPSLQAGKGKFGLVRM